MREILWRLRWEIEEKGIHYSASKGRWAGGNRDSRA